MSTEDDRELELFLKAREIHDAEEQARFLDKECAGDPDLRSEVDSLLAQDTSDDVLDHDSIALSRHFPAPPFPKEIGPFKILRVLGEGGMGIVYEAEQSHPLRRVALKVIRPEAISRSARQRFERETKLLGRLKHPGIAQIFDAGEASADGTTCPYFAMELIEGLPLVEYVQRGALALEQKLELTCDICRAIHHAHQKGVIHRDLKPNNILVDENGQPKILDFGIGKSTDHNDWETSYETSFGRVIGTLAYMSPEQASGISDEIDVLTDVYSIGVILYQLLSGTLPHSLESKVFHEAVRTICEDDPTPLSRSSRMLRGDLEVVVSKALAKDKALRYQSIDALVEDIQRYLSLEPVHARAPNQLYRLRKLVLRHKKATMAGLAVIVSVAASLGGISFYAGQVVAREELARRNRYVASMNSATGSVAAGNHSLARAQLGSTAEELRGWYWDHLRLTCDQSTKLVRIPAKSVSVTRDNRHLIAVLPNGKMQLIDASTFLTSEGSTTFGSGAICAVTSPHADQVISGHVDGGLRIWNTSDLRMISRLGNQQSHVHSLVHNPKSTQVAASFCNGFVEVWDITPAKRVFSYRSQSGRAAKAIAISPDGMEIASAHDRALRIWEIATGELVFERRADSVNSSGLEFSASGRKLVYASCNGLGAWNRDRKDWERWKSWTGWITCLFRSSDNGTLFSGSEDNEIRVWDPDSGSVKQVLHGHDQPVSSIASGHNGALVFSAAQDGIRAWNPRLKGAISIVPPSFPVTSVCFTRDHSKIVSAQAGDIVVHCSRTGRVLSKMAGHDGQIDHLVITAGDREVVSASRRGTIRTWDLGTETSQLMSVGHDGPVTSLAICPNGEQIVSADASGMVIAWNSRTGKVAQKWTPVPDDPSTSGLGPQVAIAADARHVVVAFRNIVQVWDLARMAPAFSTSAPPTQSALAVTASPDLDLIAVGYSSGVIRVWGIGEKQPRHELPFHRTPVGDLLITRDSQQIISFSAGGGEVVVSDINTGLPLGSLESPKLAPCTMCRSVMMEREWLQVTSMGYGSGSRSLRPLYRWQMAWRLPKNSLTCEQPFPKERR